VNDGTAQDSGTSTSDGSGTSEASPGDDGEAAGPEASVEAGHDATTVEADATTADAMTSDGANVDAGGIQDGGVPSDAWGPDACASVTYYLDLDGDKWGGTSSVTTCGAPPPAPATGTWVMRGGDCDDSNAMVNPGVTTYFTTGYTPAGSTQESFDYDCSGTETESGDPAHANCVASLTSCGGDGYIAATPVRTGTGVDAYCGSNQKVTCAYASLKCTASAPMTTTSAIACH
jgi:hypothetical protein